MIIDPRILFYISDTSIPVNKDSDLWKELLPTERTNLNNSVSDEYHLTIGDYFSLVSIYFSENDFERTRDIFHQVKKKDIESGDISTIAIILVKHGRFYHPSKVIIKTENESVNIVLNVATEDDGYSCVEREFPILKLLRNKTEKIPAVYNKGEEWGHDCHMVMFTGEWFDDYHEFHLSYDDTYLKMIVWDYEKGFYFLSDDQIKEVYSQASEIMTRCYDIRSFHQIQPWHHAAGDFVVKKEGNTIDVRLITVRQYTSLFENSFDDDESLMEAALIFFISLSIRMRLDRIDGVKETVWSDDLCVPSVTEGFIKGLEQQSDHYKSLFLKLIDRTSRQDIYDYAMMLVSSYHPESPDVPVIMDNLDCHIDLLNTCLNNL